MKKPILTSLKKLISQKTVILSTLGLLVVAGSSVFAYSTLASRPAETAKSIDTNTQPESAPTTASSPALEPTAPAATTPSQPEPAPVTEVDPCDIPKSETITYKGITGIGKVTIAKGCTSKTYSLKTTDKRSVDWATSPFGAFVWPSGNGSGSSDAVVHTNFEGNHTGSSIKYHIVSKDTPGTYENGLYVTDPKTGDGFLFTVTVVVIE